MAEGGFIAKRINNGNVARFTQAIGIIRTALKLRSANYLFCRKQTKSYV
jgi:hypothetical protein